MATTLLGSLAMKAKKKTRILAGGKTGLEKGYFNMRGSLECLNADRKQPAGRERRKKLAEWKEIQTTGGRVLLHYQLNRHPEF